STLARSPSMTARRRASKLRSSAAWNRLVSRTAAETNRTTATMAEEMISRKASELRRIIRLGHAVAHAANGPQHIDAELLAHTSDEYFDSVRIAVEILIVEVLDQFSARNHLALVVHEIGQQPEFERGELDSTAVDRHARALGIKQQRTAGNFAA